jgi:hypothetical protein
VTRRIDRRELLLGLGAAGLGAAVLRTRAAAAESHEAAEAGEAAVESGEAAEATGEGEEAAAQTAAPAKVEYLFVQSAEKATLSGGKLQLRGVSPSTVYFSDRPERVADHVPTNSFVKQWGKGADSFRDDPPNAALSLLGSDEVEEVVVTLRSPMLKAGTLLYEVDVLEGPKEVSGGPCSLFIDVIGRPMTPISIAGHRRRRRRRVRRAID